MLRTDMPVPLEKSEYVWLQADRGYEFSNRNSDGELR